MVHAYRCKQQKMGYRFDQGEIVAKYNKIKKVKKVVGMFYNTVEVIGDS